MYRNNDSCKIAAILALMLSLAILAGGCGGGGGGVAPLAVNPTAKGSLSIGLTDAPIDGAKKVVIDMERIEVHSSASGTAENWVTYWQGSRSIDLLEFRNGKVSLFGKSELEAGSYQQIRIFLGGGRITMNDDTEHDLQLNAGIKNTGFKLVSGFNIRQGVDTELTIDFDARKSVVVKNPNTNPQYHLKPVARVVENDVAGSITVEGTSENRVYYLYEDGFDISLEAMTTVTIDGELVTSPFNGAVSSATTMLEGSTAVAIFSHIPFASYDVYRLEGEGETAALIKIADVTLNPMDALITVKDE